MSDCIPSCMMLLLTLPCILALIGALATRLIWPLSFDDTRAFAMTIVNHHSNLSLNRIRRLFWWYRAIIPFYKTLFRLASYPEHMRRRYISFIAQVLVPHFGPSPPEYWSMPESKSISYKPSVRTPFEPIVVLGDGTKPMSVRFSMEIIDSGNGLPRNPEDCLTVCREIGASSFVEGFDPTWVDVCYDSLVYHDWRKLKGDHVPINFFFGGEFGQTGVVTKFYFFPMIRAAETGVGGMQLVSQCMARLGVGSQWESVASFVELHPQYKVYPEMVGIEGVAPTRNRVKVYLRLHPDHSSLMDTIYYTTLGGKLNADNAVSETIAALRVLWKLIFPGVGDDEVVQLKRQGSKGMLVYFEMGLDRKSVIPKVYIPIYRYCQSDAQIARAIAEYYRSTGQGGEVERNYEACLREMLPKVNLEKSPPSHQTYLGISTKKGKTQMTMYFALDLFSRG
uniref:Tryptophan dimethylallyltransferase n=1 Tax=Moniliophthora roreri TaxID=221103 RepID=A0A0W0FJH2_MONRR